MTETAEYDIELSIAHGDFKGSVFFVVSHTKEGRRWKAETIDGESCISIEYLKDYEAILAVSGLKWRTI